MPGLPHHITQRGNRRQQVFFCEGDYLFYYRSLNARSTHNGVKVEAFCLMPNHVHLILRPSDTHGLTKTMVEVHRTYTCMIK